MEGGQGDAQESEDEEELRRRRNNTPTLSLATQRTRENRARDDTLSFAKLVQALRQRQRETEEDCRRSTVEERLVPDIHVGHMTCSSVTRKREADRERKDDECCIPHSGEDEVDG